MMISRSLTPPVSRERAGLIAAALALSLTTPLAALAEGAPLDEGGAPSAWTSAMKTGIGTAYEAYEAAGAKSKVWFTLAEGIITEMAYGLIHEAQLRDAQWLIVGDDFFAEERRDTLSEVSYLHTDAQGRPLSLAYRVVNRDPQGRYLIEKHIFTDPDRGALFMRTILTAKARITPYLLINPHMGNDDKDDVGYIVDDQLYARTRDDRTYLSVHASTPMERTSAGFYGESDGWTDLEADRRMDWAYAWADAHGKYGNVVLTGGFAALEAGETRTIDVVIGFGGSHLEAKGVAAATLEAGYEAVLARFNGVGDAVGWEDYLQDLRLAPLYAQTGDGGALLHASALTLKAMEDKTHPGALIASLSIPWGDTKHAADPRTTGYRAVWVRDLYQVASALLALGDTQTPLAALRFMRRLAVRLEPPGAFYPRAWFLQKTRVDGVEEWSRVQMDQVAMPIMLAWRLRAEGLLGEAQLEGLYREALKPAAEFLAQGGVVRADRARIVPPSTEQERWEEQRGYSPSTMAAIITGLVAAADLAAQVGDPAGAMYYRRVADAFRDKVVPYTFTTSGPYGDGRYFLRVNQNEDPDDGGRIDGKNGHAPIDERRAVDAGFLELVRYGVFDPNDPHVTGSLPEIDDTTRPHDARLRYSFGPGGALPGWRRYAEGDGYGERLSTGARQGDHGDNRGRVWPIFTGERGCYALLKARADHGGVAPAEAIAQIRATYVAAMERFANAGLMLPEQVWDGVGEVNPTGLVKGEGTGGATPLAWSHAEYIRLVRSLSDGDVWDAYPIVRARYLDARGR